MLRRLIVRAGLLGVLVAALASVSPAMAASGGGCQLEGTASFSPGLTTTAAPFNYSFNGALTGCQSTGGGRAHVWNRLGR